ncbi:MAG: FtsX-like permease family protein [Bryobacteraceae bacterium]
MLRFVSLMFKNSWRNRRRTALTVVSTGISLCLLGVLLAVYAAFYFSKPSAYQALRLVTRNRVSLAVSMPMYYRDKIRSIRGVREVGILQWFGGAYKDSRDPKNFFARMAIAPESLFTLRGEMSVPEDQKKAFLQDRTGCLVGRMLADRLNFKPGDRITLVGDIFPVTLELKVRAIFDAPENAEVLYFHWKYLEESISRGRGSMVGAFSILADSPESVPRIARDVDATFRNTSFETKTESEQQFGLSFLSFLGNVKAFLLSICAAVTFTILLVSANTMAMSVRERIQEVGILKTLGFTTGEVTGIILGEAVIISLAGGALGLLLASGLCALVRMGPIGFELFRRLAIQPATAAVCLGLAVLIGVASSVVPALAAARTSIVNAVRHAG